MNPVEASRMRKALIVIISIAFTGALLIYTAQANLDLLQKIYVNPQYVIFGMLALEGGVVYWLGYYLLHWNGTHKAIALVMAVIDFILSMIGFFMDGNVNTGSQIHTALPPVLIVMSFDVMLNVGMGLLVHFLNHSPPASDGIDFIPRNSLSVANKNSQPSRNFAPQVSVRELEQMISKSVTGYLTALPQGSESASVDPLAQRLLQRPKVERVSLAHVGVAAAQGVSSLTRKAAGFIRRGSTAPLSLAKRARLCQKVRRQKKSLMTKSMYGARRIRCQVRPAGG